MRSSESFPIHRYARQVMTEPVPKYELPERPMEPDLAYQLIHDELLLDGSTQLNMATFVTTWMEPQAENLMAESFSKNMIDKDEYPQTAEIENRCINLISRLFHAPDEGVGASTIGSSETVMAIGIPFDLLDQYRPARTLSKLAIERESNDGVVPDHFVGSLQAALTSAASQTLLSLELGAEIAGTSPRTLRRWLSQQGTSWRDLIDRIHFERAAELLQHAPLTLAEISNDLGYSDPAHFTRAFQRWTGEAPSEYRQRRMNTDSSPKKIHH